MSFVFVSRCLFLLFVLVLFVVCRLFLFLVCFYGVCCLFSFLIYFCFLLFVVEVYNRGIFTFRLE